MILRLRLKRKTYPAFCVLNAFYFHTDFNLRFKRKWLVNAFDASYIAHYRFNGYAPLHRTLSLKWIWQAVSETLVLNETKPTKRSQITICEKRQTRNVQFRFMPNAFGILKPIQKSSKCVWVFRNTGANAFAKNQTHLAYEDKRDLYCIIQRRTIIIVTVYIHTYVSTENVGNKILYYSKWSSVYMWRSASVYHCTYGS